MRLDHLSYAASPDEFLGVAERLGEQLGVVPVDGGIHPGFGTRNRILPLTGGHYVEVVAPLEHPVVDRVPFSQAVKARVENGGGWMGWVVAVDDLSPLETRLGRAGVDGHRVRPDGVDLAWRQLGIRGLINDPQLPFFIHWACPAEDHPSFGGENVRLERLQLAGDPDRVTDWVGEPMNQLLADVEVDWAAPNGQPGLLSATFVGPNGVVTI